MKLARFLCNVGLFGERDAGKNRCINLANSVKFAAVKV
ncbi:hypothetical protein CAMRE0001_2523 [Campylobacter rectus RM3267]|uniref:Uncharacterized protein n=1 Tax=Campylobacter rectus RM3267 TaxID=553218 RepID=B9D3Q9_CAMRE|nr:hypothetical protein CAMRE0001_2523 [Campylobacter rectus RM3267]